MANLPKINPNDVTVTAFHSHKSARVNLREPLTIDVVREHPELWVRAQDNVNTALARGDSVTMISPDGLTLAENFIVVRALGGSLWLSKPLRLVTLEQDALFEDASHEVVPLGTGYGVRNKRDGRVDGVAFSTVEAAKSEILRRQPKRVVA